MAKRLASIRQHRQPAGHPGRDVPSNGDPDLSERGRPAWVLSHWLAAAVIAVAVIAVAVIAVAVIAVAVIAVAVIAVAIIAVAVIVEISAIAPETAVGHALA